MTNKQFTEYEKIKKEIEPLISFLKCCGKRYRYKGIGQYPMRLIKKKFSIGRKGIGTIKSTIVEIPFELQDRIIDVIEEYVDEKQKKLEEI